MCVINKEKFKKKIKKFFFLGKTLTIRLFLKYTHTHTPLLRTFKNVTILHVCSSSPPSE